jgi:hypothetical protein
MKDNIKQHQMIKGQRKTTSNGWPQQTKDGVKQMRRRVDERINVGRQQMDDGVKRMKSSKLRSLHQTVVDPHCVQQKYDIFFKILKIKSIVNVNQLSNQIKNKTKTNVFIYYGFLLPQRE